MSLQTEYWADRFAKCLKMFHLTYFLTRIIRFWHFSSAAFIEKNAERVPMASNKNNDYMCIVHACVYEHVYVDLVSSCFVACGGDGNVRLSVS